MSSIVSSGHNCPFFKWLSIFEKKWNTRIVHTLFDKEMGFNELKGNLKGITQGVLSQRLRELQKMGVIEKKTVQRKPIVVRYAVTERFKHCAKCW
ncbi:MAG: helix-turn-helix domain-containing protein [Candidatus Micrarchaeota archaeon]